MVAGLVDGPLVGALALAELNANLLDGSDSESTADTDLFADWEIKKARLLADSELYDDIAAQPEGDFWAQLAVDSPELGWAAKMGTAGTFKYQGALGLVEVKMGDGSWRPAHEHVSLAHLARWKYGAHYSSLGEDAYGRHCITPDRRIYFLGVAARVRYVPEYEFDDATYLHKCPERLTAAELHGTVSKLFKDGVDPQMIEYHEKLYAAARDSTRAGRSVVADFLSYRDFQRQQQQAA